MTSPTPEEREQILALIERMRVIAAPVGSMHSFWEDIFGAEAFLKGRPHEMYSFEQAYTAADWIKELERRLAPYPTSARPDL